MIQANSSKKFKRKKKSSLVKIMSRDNLKNHLTILENVELDCTNKAIMSTDRSSVSGKFGNYKKMKKSPKILFILSVPTFITEVIKTEEELVQIYRQRFTGFSIKWFQTVYRKATDLNRSWWPLDNNWVLGKGFLYSFKL